MRGFLAAVGAREFTEQAYETALGYPWPRPPSSFVLDGTDVLELDAWHATATSDRWPLLAFGSNGSPETLIRKFAHLPPEHQSLPVLAGDLHDFDVGAAAYPTAYASFPATLFVSPGTALRASILWVTPVQLTALTWTEVSYRLGRLDAIRFEPDLPGASPQDRVLAFSSRWGSHCIDGEVAALAALPAARAHSAGSSRRRICSAASRAPRSATVRRRATSSPGSIEDFAAAAERIGPLTQATARTFESAALDGLPGRLSASLSAAQSRAEWKSPAQLLQTPRSSSRARCAARR